MSPQTVGDRQPFELTTSRAYNVPGVSYDEPTRTFYLSEGHAASIATLLAEDHATLTGSTIFRHPLVTSFQICNRQDEVPLYRNLVVTVSRIA